MAGRGGSSLSSARLAACSSDCREPQRYMLQRKGRIISPCSAAPHIGVQPPRCALAGGTGAMVACDRARHRLCTPASPRWWASCDPSGGGLPCSTSPRCWWRAQTWWPPFRPSSRSRLLFSAGKAQLCVH